MMDFLLGLAGAAAIYAVILVNKWQVLRVIKLEVARVDDEIIRRALRLEDSLECITSHLPSFGTCAICGATGFADDMTKMSGVEYLMLRGEGTAYVSDPIVYLHDECLVSMGYERTVGVVAGWRKCPTVESKVFEKDSPKKGKG